MGAVSDQSCGEATVRLWLIADVAFAATLVLALSPDVATAPPGVRIVVVTVTAAAAVDWFCTSVLTDTVADPVETDGVETNTPL